MMNKTANTKTNATTGATTNATAAPAFDAERFLATLNARPGVYVFYDAGGAALYVGKASNLKNRVTSYFRAGGQTAKAKLMTAKIARAEVHVTRGDAEALILENNLIKDKRPRYNISLRDDKSFPYIRLTESDEYPRFVFFRGRRKPNERYYGPYPSAAAVREMLAQLHKIFRLRQCTDAFFNNRSRPCLQHQIKRCSAPCVGRIDAAHYQDDVRQAKAMLAGRDFALLDELAAKMEHASESLEFETAARYRDRIALLRRATQTQTAAGGFACIDVVAVARDADKVCFSVASIRRGRNLGARFLVRANPLDWNESRLLQAFLPQHYLDGAPNAASDSSPQANPDAYPDEILISENSRGVKAFCDALAREAGRRIEVKHRCRATRAKWIESARANTAEHLRMHLSAHSARGAQWQNLAVLLSLAEIPARIECFDISHTMGERAVGACVVADANGAVKSDYRRFNLSVTDGDDYAAMRETLSRRYQRLVREDAKLPDLVLIDGGKGQLRVAVEVFEELQLSEQITLLAVSKGRARRPGDELLHMPGIARAIRPPRAAGGLHLIQQIRDEAHRFAISGHRRRRARARRESPLGAIPGVGDARRRNLLRHFGGLREVARADVDALAKAPGISPGLANRIYAHFHD